MDLGDIKEELNGAEVVTWLRDLLINMGVEKPCDETLQTIR